MNIGGNLEHFTIRMPTRADAADAATSNCESEERIIDLLNYQIEKLVAIENASYNKYLEEHQKHVKKYNDMFTTLTNEIYSLDEKLFRQKEEYNKLKTKYDKIIEKHQTHRNKYTKKTKT